MVLDKAAKGLSFAVVLGGVALATGTAPAQAGFFDQLFGLPAAPVAQPYAPPPGAYSQPDAIAPSVRPRRVRRHYVDAKPMLQKTTDLMRDTTLRPGDAVMMKNGLQVFEGDEGNRHVRGDFVSLNDADSLSKRERIQLAAADTTRNDPLRHSTALSQLASGRSAAIATPIVTGVKITDARGHVVRYVGP